MSCIYFIAWLVLHVGTFLLLCFWITPALLITVTWGVYRDWSIFSPEWSIFAPEWSHPWWLSDMYAKWVNRVTKAKARKEVADA